MIAKYIRLSSADEDAKYGDKPESNSVTHQRMLLDSYIASHSEFDGCKVLESLDDGRSGTNFTRPGVLALLGAAQRREIDCVIVKDFSRFGRNYLEVGNYLEKVFPALGVRFISVNDGYDSKNYPYGAAGDIGSGLMALVYDLYSRELSQKIKDSRRQYAGRGQCVNAYPIYGYVKSPEDRRTWIIEPESAQVVRQIFDLFLSGKGQTDIAKILNAEGIPTPSQHQRSLGSKRQLWNSQRMQNEWAHTTVARLLRDERYTGTLIALKTSVTEVGNMNSAKPLDKSEQVRIPGAFEAIIPQETFNAVQQKLDAGRITRKKSEPRPPSIFSRKLKCGTCGLGLLRHKVEKGWYYSCGCRSWNVSDACRQTRIFETDLTKAVLASIRFQAQLAKKAEVEFDKQEKRRRREVDASRAYERKLQAKIDSIITQKRDAYLEYDQGKSSWADYTALCGKLDGAIKKYREKLSDMGSVERLCQPDAEYACRSQIDSLKRLSNLRTLDRATVEALIWLVQVYAGGRIEIIWNFGSSNMQLRSKEEHDL